MHTFIHLTHDPLFVANANKLIFWAQISILVQCSRREILPNVESGHKSPDAGEFLKFWEHGNYWTQGPFIFKATIEGGKSSPTEATIYWESCYYFSKEISLLFKSTASPPVIKLS